MDGDAPRRPVARRTIVPERRPATAMTCRRDVSSSSCLDHGGSGMGCVMGFSMQTLHSGHEFRLTEWVYFSGPRSNWKPDWHARASYGSRDGAVQPLVRRRGEHQPVPCDRTRRAWARSRASGPVAQRLASELRALVRSTPFCYVWYFCIWLSHALCRRLYSIFCPPKKVVGNMFARSHERTSRPERPRTSKTFLVTLSPLPVVPPDNTQAPPRRLLLLLL